MHARHVTVSGTPDKIDEGIRSVRDEVLPVLQGCQGFRGQLLLVDRQKGLAIGISLWDSEEDMNASEEKVHQTRQATADRVESTAAPTVDLYEMPIFEIT